MKIQMTLANTFKIEPGKKYLVIINIDEMWSKAQKAELEQKLESMGMTVVYLPKGSKYKVVEAANE